MTQKCPLNNFADCRNDCKWLTSNGCAIPLIAGELGSISGELEQGKIMIANELVDIAHSL